MVLFYAYTQFHLFNCINLKLSLHKDDLADLCVIRPYDAQLSAFYPELIKNSLFHRIYDFDGLWLDDRSRFTKLKTAGPVVKSIVANAEKISAIRFPEKVEAIYTYGSSVEMYLLYDHIRKTNNKSVRLIGYEEGSGSYCTRADNQLGTFSRMVIKNVLHIDMPDSYDSFMVYQPECMGISQPCRVTAMPKIDRSSRELFNRVFGFQDRGAFSRSVFFNGPDRPVDRYLSDVIKGLRITDLSIKRHPRSRQDDSGYDFKYNDAQWEMICLNSSLSDKLLISQISTAMFTPKSMFDEEPYLVFLYNLEEARPYSDFYKDRHFLNYLEKFAATYENLGRIFIPGTESELKDIIQRIMEMEANNEQ